MNIIEQIKAEVERLKATNPSEYNYQNAEGYVWALDDVLSFLSTLESEKPMQEGLEEELDKWRHSHFNGERDGHFSGEYLERTSQLDFARHFAKWGAEHLADASKTSPNDLEEAARQYFENPENSWKVKEVFIAGAKWMEEQLKK